MPTPNTPDLSYSDLISALDDNNSGAITPEDIRSLASLSRPSIAATGAAGVGSSNFKGLFSTGQSLPGTPSYNYAYLQSLTTVAASYNKSYARDFLENMTGTLEANVGIRYTDNGEDAADQPRSFQYEWELVIDSPTQSFWIVSFYVLPAGEILPTGPTDSDAWANFKLHHCEAVFASGYKTIDSVQVWKASTSGSKTVILNTGDAIVPIVEYWGKTGGDSTIAAIDASVAKWSFDVVSSGVVRSGWNDDNYWSIESNRDRAVYDIQQGGTVLSDTPGLTPITVTGSATPPGTSEQGKILVDNRAATSGLYVYTNDFLDWTQPWNLPWGYISKETTPTADSGGPSAGGRTDGYPAAGVATTTATDTGFSLQFSAKKNRKYKITIQGHVYSYGNDQTLSIGGSATFAGSISSLAAGRLPMESGLPGGPSSGTELDDLVWTAGINATGVGFGAAVTGGSTLSFQEAENTSVFLYDGATVLSRKSVPVEGAFATNFEMVYLYDAPANASKTLTLKIARDNGNGTHFLFHSPTSYRPVTLFVEDIGPASAPANIPPTS